MNELSRGQPVILMLLTAVAALALLLVCLTLRRWLRKRRWTKAQASHAVEPRINLVNRAGPLAADLGPATPSSGQPMLPLLRVGHGPLPASSPVAGPGTPLAASDQQATTPPRLAPVPVPLAPAPPVTPAGQTQPRPPGLTIVPASPRPRPKPRQEVDTSVLSPETLLARAHEFLATGASEEAAGQLRLCVRLASKLKQPVIEAAARLELGDLARASGDLTTACEHWQLARSLYSALKRDIDTRAAEQRMERARCPSDWVLNEF